MTAIQKVYKKLPPTFSRQQVLKEAKKQGYSYALASSLPEKLLYKDLAERVAKAEYKKLPPTE